MRDCVLGSASRSFEEFLFQEAPVMREGQRGRSSLVLPGGGVIKLSNAVSSP